MLPALLYLMPSPAHCQPLGVVDVTVRDSATGAPIAGARLRLDGPGTTLDATADAKGRFHFARLRPGQYSISAEFVGYVMAGDSRYRKAPPTRLDLRLPADGGPPTDPTGAPHALVTIPMMAYAVIVGKISEPGGAPCTGCPVELMREAPAGLANPAMPRITPVLSVPTNDQGEYLFTPLPPGNYYVLAGAGGTPPG